MKTVNKKYRTDALMANSSFWLGFFGVFNLFGTSHSVYGRNAKDADFRAMRSDWGAVGVDAQNALRETGKAAKHFTSAQLRFDFNESR